MHDTENHQRLAILMVEDHPINQLVMVKLLERLGYPPDIVTIANNGVEAIKLVQSNNYDVIFMDLMMPEMGGIEAAQIILGGMDWSKRKKPHIVAMTASTSQVRFSTRVVVDEKNIDQPTLTSAIHIFIYIHIHT